MRQLLDSRHGKHSSEREHEGEQAKIGDVPQPSSLELQMNLTYEPKYRSWIVGEVMRNESISYDDAIDGGAEIAGCGQQAVERYLRKLCSCNGPFRIEGSGDSRRVITKEEFLRLTKEEILDAQARAWRDDVVKLANVASDLKPSQGESKPRDHELK